MVYTVYKGRCFLVFGRCRNNNMLCSRFNVVHCFFGGNVCAGTIDDIVNTRFLPGNLQRIGTGKNIYMFPVDIDTGLVMVKSFWKSSEYGIILKHIYHIFKVCVSEIDRSDFNFRHVHCCTDHYSSYSPKSVNSNSNRHIFFLLNSLIDNDNFKF